MTRQAGVWMPWYWGDYLRDTMHLRTEAHGAYILLIGAYWISGEPLLDDDDHLMAITRCDQKTWNRLRPILIKFFDVFNGLWRHSRIDDEIERANSTSNARRRAGRLGGKASTKIRAKDKQLVHQTSEQNPTPSQSPSPLPAQAESKEEEDSAQIEEIRAVGEGDSSKLDLPSFLDRDSPDCAVPVSRFERWWRHWTISGTKRGKVAAEKMFLAVLLRKGAPSVENLIAGLDRYMAHCKAEQTDVSKIIHPERWLSKGRWEDDYPEPKNDDGLVAGGRVEPDPADYDLPPGSKCVGWAARKLTWRLPDGETREVDRWKDE